MEDTVKESRLGIGIRVRWWALRGEFRVRVSGKGGMQGTAGWKCVWWWNNSCHAQIHDENSSLRRAEFGTDGTIEVKQTKPSPTEHIPQSWAVYAV